MRFHWLDDAGNIAGTGVLKLGASIKGIHRAADTRPDYVTIAKEEIQEATLTEKQMVQYFSEIKKTLDFGGKVYLEIANYE